MTSSSLGMSNRLPQEGQKSRGPTLSGMRSVEVADMLADLMARLQLATSENANRIESCYCFSSSHSMQLQDVPVLNFWTRDGRRARDSRDACDLSTFPAPRGDG